MSSTEAEAEAGGYPSIRNMPRISDDTQVVVPE
jgi:hypothetical protein